MRSYLSIQFLCQRASTLPQFISETCLLKERLLRHRPFLTSGPSHKHQTAFFRSYGMSPNANAAAWLTAAKAHPFEVKSAPAWTPGENEILVKNHAVAINPIDGKLQTVAFVPFTYPTVLGQDVAGEVVEVGPNVTRFKPGDRVLGTCLAMSSNRAQDGGFQSHTVLSTKLATTIPNNMTYEEAAVIPLGSTTAAAGLFQAKFLNLQHPTSPAQKPTGHVVLIWGGSSSVGTNAVQLAVAAGYEVVTTASPKNFDYVKSLGASEVFDYKSSTVTTDIIKSLEGKTLAGALDCTGGWIPCMEVVQKSQGGSKFVATTVRGFPQPDDGSGVQINNVYGTTIAQNEVSKAIYEDFMPAALASGQFRPSPDPMVIGKGLDKIQEAVDLHSKGVSAKKVVVTL